VAGELCVRRKTRLSHQAELLHLAFTHRILA
jgi:hypothetical protein